TLSDEPFQLGAGHLPALSDPHEAEVPCTPQFTDGGVGNPEEFGRFESVEEQLRTQLPAHDSPPRNGAQVASIVSARDASHVRTSASSAGVTFTKIDRLNALRCRMK